MHRSRITPGIDMVPSHFTDYGTQQESNGLAMLRCAVVTGAFLLLLSLLSLGFSACKSAQVAKVKPPRRPLLGLRDVESPAPKYGWYPSDAGQTH